MSNLTKPFTEIPAVASIISRYPILLDEDDGEHILVFRRVLEWAMTQGRWTGKIAEES